MLNGKALLQKVAERIVCRYLATLPGTTVVPAAEARALGRGVDLAYECGDSRRTIMVKPDVYYGTDPTKAADRTLPFYRGDLGVCALQSVADSASHDPGWMLTSDADEIFYYFLALSQQEADVKRLVDEPDEPFFSGLKVERDDLLVLPMTAARTWFTEQADRLPSRPITLGGSSAWYRLAPRADLEAGVWGATDRGPIFARLVS